MRALRRGTWWDGPLPTVVLPVAVALLTVPGSVVASYRVPGAVRLDAPGVALLLVGPAALVLRRANPPVVLAVCGAALVAYVGIGYPFGPVVLPTLVALGAAVGRGHRRPAYATITVVFTAVLVTVLLQRGGDPEVWTGGVFWVAVLAAVAAANEGLRARRERVAAARATAEETDRRRGVQERLRIAQELHDVLGHHVSLINVQAGVALYLLDDDPEQARTALAAIKQSSRDLLREMRSTLGVLRAVDEPAPRHPTPGIDRLGALADEVRAAGQPVEVTVHGEPRALPTGVDLAAYRIVQEALTNVRKHAGRATAQVLVDYAPGALVVRVDDDGVGPAADARDGGDGLPGMRDRAVVLGGTMEAGAGPGGGFRVRASLPTGEAP